MKTSLVIGSDGFIGTPFCHYLESQGEKVIRFDIKRNKKEDARIAKLPLSGVDCVYFLAWDVGGSKYLYEPKLQKNQLEWNLDLMKNVFDQVGKAKKKFLFVSSQLSEEVDTVYGVTKRLGEVWTELLGGVCIRVWNAYGYMEGEDIKSHVISDFIYQALKTKKIKMMTNGQEWRQFTHITDLSKAFYMALHTKGLRKTVYDASSYEWIRIIDIAHMIAGLTGAKVFPGDKIGHDPAGSPNRGRIPHWLPSIEIEDGIKSMIEQARTHISNGKKK
jgi:nucleoside-diphosphate-sugar epimerase